MNLIQQIRLPNGRTTTNLGLGCAGILRLPTLRGRETLLRTAVDMGLTHFDVARMYGLGEAEGILGTALKRVADRTTIGTKFGLPYAVMTGRSTRMQSIARYLFNLSPALKKTLRRISARRAATQPEQPWTPNRYRAEEMETSLALSLQKLQRGFVDLLYLHEPGLKDIIDPDLSDALRRQKAEGKVGAFGLSGHRREVEHYLETRPDVCGDAIQYSYPMFAADAEGQPLPYSFTGMFSVIDTALGTLMEYLGRDRTFERTWSERLSIDLGKRENAGIVILAIALTLNPQGLVLFFTSSSKRLRQIIHRLGENQFTSENLLAFRAAAREGMHAR